MKKILTLIRVVGALASLKIFAYVILRKFQKRLSSFPVEVYQLSNFLTRNEGSIHSDDGRVNVAFKYKGQPLKFEIRKGASDAHVLIQIYERLEYLPLITLIRNFDHIPIRNIIDAGANAGFTSVLFASHFPAARIVSIEPDKGNVTLLQRNTALNNVNGNILDRALWNRNEPVVIENNFRDNREWSRQVKATENGVASGGQLSGITIFEVMKSEQWQNIDILKIDIEGAEEIVFADRTESLAILEKVKFLAIELHDEVDFRTKFEQLLRDAGFIYTNTGESLIGYNAKKIK